MTLSTLQNKDLPEENTAFSETALAENSLQKDLRISGNYLLLTVFCIIFGAVYEHFSFGVHSFYMRYAFLPLLLLGVVPCHFLALHPTLPAPVLNARRGWRAGIAALCIGSLYTGALEIYGTASRFSCVYLIAGIFWLVTALLLQLFHAKPCMNPHTIVNDE